MPTVEENIEAWTNYPWSAQGDEWSSPWLGTDFLWWGTILPRIHSFVPTGTILEIAPGFGRFTKYLKDLGNQLVLVDVTERCIEACQERFAQASNIEYFTNDGKSLAMLEDYSLDFVFSFDSLVHVEADVIETYLAQLSKKLKPNGVGFIHHSNLEGWINSLTTRIPLLMKLLKEDWRAESVSARQFSRVCEKVGLTCISQELVNWNTKLPITTDCFSVFTPQNSMWSRSNRVFNNRRFMQEAAYLANLSKLYGETSFSQ